MATKNAVAASSAAITNVKQQSITNFLESPLDKTKMMPLMTSTPRNSSISQKRKALDSIDKDQMILDVGQKNIGMTNCQDVS
uniref:Uncharacterized protein n=1 Tax=Panagrolaimus sp. PS1159 TaxID=55785 RepID=A0AC35GSA4_9BILA